MNTLFVLPIGSAVRVAGSIDAIVMGICIRGRDHITYECAWWDGNDRKCQWLETDEIRKCSIEQADRTIGFH